MPIAKSQFGDGGTKSRERGNPILLLNVGSCDLLTDTEILQYRCDPLNRGMPPPLSLPTWLPLLVPQGEEEGEGEGAELP